MLLLLLGQRHTDAHKKPACFVVESTTFFHTLSDLDTRVVYCSSTTLINIDRSVEFDRVEVSVARTENNVVSKDSLSNPLMIGPQTHLLDGILAIRAPDLRKAVPSIKGLAEEQIETALAFWASTLNTYAEDVLQGSFAIFAELSAKYKTE